MAVMRKLVERHKANRSFCEWRTSTIAASEKTRSDSLGLSMAAACLHYTGNDATLDEFASLISYQPRCTSAPSLEPFTDHHLQENDY